MPRGRGRGRGSHRGAVNRAVAAKLRAQNKWKCVQPSVTPPKITCSTTVEMTLLCHTMVVGSTRVVKRVRVEDVIKACLKATQSTASPENYVIQPRWVDIRGYAESATKSYNPAFTAAIFDPLTNNIVKEEGAQGTTARPAALRFIYPNVISDHVLGWDGVIETSATLVQIASSTADEYDVVVHATIRHDKLEAPTL